MKFLKSISFFVLVFSFVLSSCKKDQLLTDASAKLDFSTDSVLFDTVFTTIGSTTKIFKIYNRHHQTMNISRIFLAEGPASPFKLNVDGISGKSITDVEIMGGDSLFVFVQVTINPNNINSPLLVKDSIVFETNGNLQDVKLTAVGQDVYLHVPDHFPTNGIPPYSIIPCSGGVATWTNDKPHLIFGYAVVDSACTLTMLPGTRVHLYNGGVLWVYKDGTLIVNGAKNNEVTFQGARLEPEYKDIPGQWGQIWLSSLSKNNVIDWAIIKNGGIGIRMDTVAPGTNPTLKLTNTIIKNMTAAAIYGLGARLWSSNCLFANSGQYVAALTIGGSYSFEHCTFANYWTGAQRTTGLLAMNNYYQSGSTILVRPLDTCYFKNCILYGDLTDEIEIDSITGAGTGYYFRYQFDHCFLKTSLNTSNPQFYNTIYKNSEPGFQATSENHFDLLSTANARDKGLTTTISSDLNNASRDLVTPDVGAYEFH